MDRLSKFMSKAINFLLMLFVGMLIIFTFSQVLCRFVFKISIAWSEEIVRINFVWMIFLGAAIAVKEKSHLVMDLITGNMKGGLKKGFNVGILLFIILIYAVIFISGTEYCIRSIGKTAVTMPIPANCVYIAAPVSAVFGVFFAIERIIAEFKGQKSIKEN